MGYAAGITFAVISWGYLVFLAIDFGDSARSGETRSWAFLALAALGAMAALFVALMLVSRLSRALGVVSPPEPTRRHVDEHLETESPTAAPTPVVPELDLPHLLDRPQAHPPGSHRGDHRAS